MMNVDSQSRGIQIDREDGTTHVLDVRCGQCVACRGALDFWCLQPRPEGVRLFSLDSAVGPDVLHRWLGALAALATVAPDPDGVLLVLEDVDPLLASELVQPWHTGPVVTSGDGRDEETRARLSMLSPTARAQVVLTLHAARTAVRAVERGGHVCLPDLAVDSPSVTELVQRDVKLVAPRQIGDLVEHITWAGLGGRLQLLLDTYATTAGAAQ